MNQSSPQGNTAPNVHNKPLPEEIPSHKRMKLSDRISRDEAAELLRVSVSTLNKLRREKLITGIQIGPRKFEYSRVELLHYVKMRVEESGLLLDLPDDAPPECREFEE